MSRDSTIAALAAAGYGDADARSRAALVERVADGFERRFGRAPSWRWFVPGRIEVFGKHTDYAGGRSLMTAVPRGFAVAAAPRDEARVAVCDLAGSHECTIEVRGPATLERGWANYVATVVRRLAANFPAASLGVDVAIVSDLPRAAGLSSSSALVVSVASVLVRRGELEATAPWAAIPSTHHLAWYLGCVENGLDYPGLPGSAGVGTLGGSEDHTAILTCRAGHLSQNRYAPIEHLGDVPMPQGWTFVVATSGVVADKAGSALDRYNRLSRGTAVLKALWNDNGSGPAARSLAAALDSAPDAESRLRGLIARSADVEFDREALARRLTHFVREDARVADAARAFAVGAAARLTDLAAASQAEADALLGNQIEETRILVRTALAEGAIAASYFGAGFGGSVWALVPSADAYRLATDWLAAYRAEQPRHTLAEAFVAAPGPGRLAL